MRHAKGFVLVVVLILLQLVFVETILVYEQLKNRFLQTNQTFQQKQTEMMAIYLTNRLMKEYLFEPVAHCIIPKIMPFTLSTKPQSFWQTQACVGKFQEWRYYYVLEKLEADDCALIPTEDGTTNAIYWRLSVLMQSHFARSTPFLLQATMVKRYKSQHACNYHSHFVTEGPQSLREFTVNFT